MARPPAAAGTLELVQDGRRKPIAVRNGGGPRQRLTRPDRAHFGQGPAEPFHFSFPDLAGRRGLRPALLLRRRAGRAGPFDPFGQDACRRRARFEPKVASWCPNCHDEAPFPEESYKQYHARGLKVVGLFFEEADQLKDPVRVQAFIRQYGIEYRCRWPARPANSEPSGRKP